MESPALCRVETITPRFSRIKNVNYRLAMEYSSTVPRRGNNSQVLQSKTEMRGQIWSPPVLSRVEATAHSFCRAKNFKLEARYGVLQFCAAQRQQLASSAEQNNGSGSVSQRYGSEDPDPYQNCTHLPDYQPVHVLRPRGCGSTRPSSVVCGTPHLPDYQPVHVLRPQGVWQYPALLCGVWYPPPT